MNEIAMPGEREARLLKQLKLTKLIRPRQTTLEFKGELERKKTCNPGSGAKEKKSVSSVDDTNRARTCACTCVRVCMCVRVRVHVCAKKDVARRE